MSVEHKYRKLDDVSHVILRPGMYIGSIKPHTSNKFLINDDKMSLSEATYNPGFLKIFDEILTNSVDEGKRDGSKLNTIKVNIEKNRISIWDNGGIPVVKHKDHDEWIPEMIFSNLKAGSNFNDDEKRLVAGTNGVGSTLSNIYSKEFRISTCDGKNGFVQLFSNNMRNRTIPTITKDKKAHTEISYLPDYEKFSMNNMDETHFNLLKKRVIDIAGCNPELKIYFNDELIKIKSFEDYIKMYTDDYIFETDKNWSVGISVSENGFQQVSFANSTDTYDGGSHVDYILNQIVVKLREFFLKKHKVDVKPSELKNHMFLFLNSTVVNPSFSSQTKEKLITEVKDFGYTYEVTDKFINKILKSEIVNSVLDWVSRKAEAEENKQLRALNKSLGKIKVDKLIDAKGKDRSKCILGIFEGDSAISAVRKFRDPQVMGAFALKGKFMNVSDISNQKLIQNNEAVNLMAAIGLKLGEKAIPRNLRYNKIYFFCDEDTDGHSIVGLLINFLNRYWPELFEQNVVYKVNTPIVVCEKSKKKIPFYSQQDYDNWLENNDPKSWNIEYKKGLASLTDDEYENIISNPRTNLLKKDKNSDKYLDVWFGKSSDLRKDELLK